jgi:hypothetical protein
MISLYHDIKVKITEKRSIRDCQVVLYIATNSFFFFWTGVTVSGLVFYPVDTSLPFFMATPTVPLLHFVAYGVWIDNLVPLP